MTTFEYTAPESLTDAVSLLSRDGARAFAGGTDLLDQLRERRKSASLVVDLKRIPELNELSFDREKGLELGAAVPCYRIYEHAEITAAYPGLADAASLIGGIQIQSRASLGGNICNASPAADGIPPLIVHGARCRVIGPGGTREIPAEAFATAPGKNALEKGEVLVSFHLPPAPDRSSARYLRFIPRNEMDIAVAGAASFIQLADDGRTIKDARIAICAVAPTPLLVEAAANSIIGQPAGEESFERAAEEARKAAQPITDMRGEEWQRRHLTGVLVRRTLEQAIERIANQKT